MCAFIPFLCINELINYVLNLQIINKLWRQLLQALDLESIWHPFILHKYTHIKPVKLNTEDLRAVLLSFEQSTTSLLEFCSCNTCITWNWGINRGWSLFECERKSRLWGGVCRRFLPSFTARHTCYVSLTLGSLHFFL